MEMVKAGTDTAEQPFHTIESAHEFMVVLEEVIAEAHAELRILLEDANSASDERRKEALVLALFKISHSKPTPARAGAF